LSATALGALLMSGASFSSGAPRVDDLVPQTPAAFLPGGILGIQLGGSWGESKQNPSLQQLTCQPPRGIGFRHSKATSLLFCKL